MAKPSKSKNALVPLRPGHLEIIGETAAKILLYQKGWNPYTRFLDEDKVDLIARRNVGNTPVYREIQVKYRRLYEPANPSGWEAKLFDVTAWYTADEDEFIAHRQGLFIMFLFFYPDRRPENDVLLFPSGDLHAMIKRAPQHKKGSKTKSLYISRSCVDSRWYVRLTRQKFAQIDASNCIDVSKYQNNFVILE